MKKNRILALALAVAVPFLSVRGEESAGYEDYAEDDYETRTVTVQAMTVVPQGGSSIRRRSGAAFRAGWYVDDFLSVEATAAWLEDTAGLGVNGLWHWWGYEAIDPFFTFGVNGWIDGGVGPSVGWGIYWHYDDNWSFRADASATLDVDGEPGMGYTFALGVQYTF